ncbi:ribbon-helix-helix protein, CopG family [Nocardia neocaledoniensis]|jgi:predicted transcriptional regulator|uniref:ribbon-helix-helix protein, CopG family n=1 Tax=Nocardia neocaledoniensis TaxID=236511 RepID=UPI00245502EE|nr:ribbon-helix-helix protein, CopG family [Nocardia neocaledoniensis]
MAWTMRLTDEEEAALAAQADGEGRSKNEIMRDALRAYLLRNRTWETPLLNDDETFDLGGPISKDDIHDAMNRSA